MNVKNIKSFIEFCKFLGVTDCISQVPRNNSKSVQDSHNNIEKKSF